MNWLKKISQEIENIEEPAAVPEPVQQPAPPQPQPQPQIPAQQPQTQVGGKVVAGINWGKGRKPYLALKEQGELPPKSLEFFLGKGWRAFKGRDGQNSFTKLVTPRNLEEIKAEIEEFTTTTSIPVDLENPQVQKLFEQMPTAAAPVGSINEAGKAELGEIREKINEQLKNLKGEERKSKLAEIISENIGQLASEVGAAGGNEDIKNMLAYASHFWGYSPFNVFLLLMQAQSRGINMAEVGSAKRWEDIGRKVNQGETPLYVTGPDKGGKAWPIASVQVPGQGKVKVAPKNKFQAISVMQGTTSQGSLDPVSQAYYNALSERYRGDTSKMLLEAQRRIVMLGSSKRFVDMPVYDISQTDVIEGFAEKQGRKPYTGIQDEWWMAPKLDHRDEKSNILYRAAMEVAKEKGIKVEDAKDLRGAQGTSAGGEIQILGETEGEGRLRAMVHELAHELLHWEGKKKRSEMGEKSSRRDKEIDADATAYTVLRFFGYDAKYAGMYLLIHGAKPEDVNKRQVHIMKAVSTILKGMIPMLIGSMDPKQTQGPAA